MRDPEQFRHPVQQGNVLVPGIPVLAPGVERYAIKGAGACAVEIFEGDEFTVMNEQGLQLAELVFFAPDGRSDIGMFGGHNGKPANGLKQILANDDEFCRSARVALQKAGFNLDTARAVHVLSESNAYDTITFCASIDGLLIVSAPGTPMHPAEQNTPTPIILYVKRHVIVHADNLLAPPDPLANPLHDINIKPGHASAYEVGVGQYIQVVDVQGRECSDFQALSLRGLDVGEKYTEEHAIDPTTTRSLLGRGYPAPGLYAKYWSMSQIPLVEIVQDTCGRHDTFGLACTARYYDDLGYPGHANCTDNINDVLAKYNVKPRAGWPAINFFFNTFIDSLNVIGMDDPWSRPGDYVLLRALTDMVCVSTACPCDVDSANGWNPTDIQVRVYKKTEDFKRSIAVRSNTAADMSATKESGFYKSFAKHTRDFTEYNGYWLPNQINNHGAIAEYWACRKNAVVMDLSALRKYEVTGPDAEKLLQMCLTRDIKKLSDRQVVYTAMCYEHGGMIDDGTVFKLGANNFRWIGGSDTSGEWLREQAQKNNLQAWVRNSTDQLHNIALQGPKSKDILSEIIWTAPTETAITELGWFRFCVARIGDFDGVPVVVSRTGYTGELGYEIQCHPKDAQTVFGSVWNAGVSHGLIPFGLKALDMVRIESGLVFAGNEFCDQTDPFEAGIGFTVPLKSKKDEFIGREALLRRANNPRYKLVGLNLQGGLVPSSGTNVFIGRAKVGVITSAVKSPILDRVIALCRIDITHSEHGTQVEVGQLDGHQKRIPAIVVAVPHFDPTKERVKGNYTSAIV